LQQSLAALERIAELEKLFQLRYEADQRQRAATSAALDEAAAFEPPDGADDYLEPVDAAVPCRPAVPIQPSPVSTQPSPAPPFRSPSVPHMSSVPLVPYVPKPVFDGAAPAPAPALSAAANSAYYSQAAAPPSVAYPDVKPLGTMPQ